MANLTLCSQKSGHEDQAPKVFIHPLPEPNCILFLQEGNQLDELLIPKTTYCNSVRRLCVNALGLYEIFKGEEIERPTILVSSSLSYLGSENPTSHETPQLRRIPTVGHASGRTQTFQRQSIHPSVNDGR